MGGLLRPLSCRRRRAPSRRLTDLHYMFVPSHAVIQLTRGGQRRRNGAGRRNVEAPRTQDALRRQIVAEFLDEPLAELCPRRNRVALPPVPRTASR
jgi:hypothetical protein